MMRFVKQNTKRPLFGRFFYKTESDFAEKPNRGVGGLIKKSKKLKKISIKKMPNFQDVDNFLWAINKFS